jgi:hypothetical protein
MRPAHVRQTDERASYTSSSAKLLETAAAFPTRRITFASSLRAYPEVRIRSAQRRRLNRRAPRCLESGLYEVDRKVRQPSVVEGVRHCWASASLVHGCQRISREPLWGPRLSSAAALGDTQWGSGLSRSDLRHQANACPTREAEPTGDLLSLLREAGGFSVPPDEVDEWLEGSAH